MQPERDDNLTEAATGPSAAAGCGRRETCSGGGFEAEMLRVAGNP
jgi:hypothetical protein